MMKINLFKSLNNGFLQLPGNRECAVMLGIAAYLQYLGAFKGKCCRNVGTGSAFSYAALPIYG